MFVFGYVCYIFLCTDCTLTSSTDAFMYRGTPNTNVHPYGHTRIDTQACTDTHVYIVFTYIRPGRRVLILVDVVC